MKWKLIITIIILSLIILVAAGSFEIKITNADHLDSNRKFISSIYNEVYQLDGIWSEKINENEYVRVRFEKNLTKNNDITIYPRIVSGNPRIEVYEVNGDEIIAEFISLNPNEYNKVYLTNLQGIQDVFDLKIVNGSVEFDHIIDPEEDWITNGDFNLGESDWNLDIVVAGKQGTGAWEDTGRTGGSIYMMDGDRNSVAELHWNQTFNVNSTVINGLDYANLSFCYNVTTYLSIDSYTLTVSLVNPSSVEVVSWAHPVAGLEPWTCISVDVTSNLTDAGDYTIRLKHNSDVGNNAATELAKEYWDDVSLNITYTSALSTCAPDAGNWAIDCSEDCIKNTDFTVPDNITLTGIGSFILNANMTFTNSNWEIYKDDDCELIINPGGSIQ